MSAPKQGLPRGCIIRLAAIDRGEAVGDADNDDGVNLVLSGRGYIEVDSDRWVLTNKGRAALRSGE